MTVSTLTPAPGTSPVPGTGANAETPWTGYRPTTARDFVALRAAADPDVFGWLDHIRAAAACTRPIRLVGDLVTARKTGPDTAVILDHRHTDDLPDRAIYKPCGNRRARVCPACARTYQRDAYQILRSFLVGGKGVPTSVAQHPAVFATFTAPSFGLVHHRVVKHHTCTNRKRCDCRAEPCHARTRDAGLCVHGNPVVCFARHERDDRVLGRPMCLDCYDHAGQVVWNLFAGELWRRTKQAAERHLAQLAKRRGIPPVTVKSATGKPRPVPPVRLAHGKAAEFQVRAAVHFHALMRIDGVDPADPTAAVPPPPGFTSIDLEDAIRHAVTHVAHTTPTHPDKPEGWHVVWGDQVDVRHITLAGGMDITDTMAAAYLAKYATKSTEVTGHSSTRITPDTINEWADPDGDHNARLIDACWRIGRPTHTPAPLSQRPGRPHPAKALGPRWRCPDCGRHTRLTACLNCNPTAQPEVDTKPANSGAPNPYARLRRWAHMLGFGGHFLTKARRGCPTFGQLRAARIEFRRATDDTDTAVIRTADHTDDETTLVVGLLTFAGAGWHNTGDALLANTSAAMARARREAARDELAHEIGSTLAGAKPAAA